MDELKRFKNNLKNSEELRIGLDKALQRLVAEGRQQSDGEIMVAAAKELGYDISITALEQSKAEEEALDPEELENISGGNDGVGDCIKDYNCTFTWHAKFEDENGHNMICVTAWHCFTAALHTESNEKKLACWSDYKCVFSSKQDY